jgi:hypothetical protein
MKSVFVFFGLLIISDCALGQYQSSLIVNSKGKIYFNDKKVKKTKELKSILAEKNSSELNSMFKKYRNKRLVHSLISRIRDFSLTYGVINEEFKPTIQPIPLAIGIGGTAVSRITRKYQNKQLNELVDYFNYLESAQMYLKESKGINP